MDKKITPTDLHFYLIASFFGFVFAGAPIHIGITLYILSISSVSEVMMVKVTNSQI